MRNELIGTADLPLSDSGLLRLKLDGLSPTHAPEAAVIDGSLAMHRGSFQRTGHEGQIEKLSEDCLDYVDELLDVAGFDDPACVIYAGMWCPTSTAVVSRFVYNRLRRGVDMNDLEICAETFRDEYATAADCEEYAEGYANRAEMTLEFVEGIT